MPDGTSLLNRSSAHAALRVCLCLKPVHSRFEHGLAEFRQCRLPLSTFLGLHSPTAHAAVLLEPLAGTVGFHTQLGKATRLRHRHGLAGKIPSLESFHH